ncbi:hypothetical protein LASUN_13310 [Lentilactobacillus sunkii]|jgi:hypothetical protein|uniref:Uncharacterized protein n=1 Tax=Lentilactobacillus sunkii TaxID=481719 RepID=A0A1E7XCM7_9LACO|nr:hypothetical protein [Lentilactobacillus sunkii]OFA10781.1 hypothetical protein LASUN_13310 [Lentilactobacillus sunkii]
MILKYRVWDGKRDKWLTRKELRHVRVDFQGIVTYKFAGTEMVLSPEDYTLHVDINQKEGSKDHE